MNTPQALNDPMSRRGFLQAAGALGALALLPACRGASGSTIASAAPTWGPTAGTVSFANWPSYIDRPKASDSSLARFSRATGIEVAYHDVIDDYPTFFGEILPQLQGGQPTGYDLIVLGGRELSLLHDLGYTASLADAPRPNFERHAAPWVAERGLDPEATFTMPWQGGLTGIAVDHRYARGPITMLDDLADPAKVGANTVGMITMEMGDFVMAQMGIDVATSGPAEWKEAADWLRMQRDAGTVYAYYDIGYLNDLDAGNVSVTMAWSGDIVFRHIWNGKKDLEFVLPQGRGLLWSDELVVPAGAEHPSDALALADFFYKPEIAKLVTEWVLFLSPVAGVQQELLRDADAAESEGDHGFADLLRATADDPFAFPDESLIGQMQAGRILRSDEELDEWNALFQPIAEGI